MTVKKAKEFSVKIITIKEFLPIVTREKPKKKVVIPKKKKFDIKNEKFRTKGLN